MKSRWLFALLPMLTLNLPAAYAQTIEPGLWEIKQDIRTPDRPEMAAQMAQSRQVLPERYLCFRPLSRANENLGNWMNISGSKPGAGL